MFLQQQKQKLWQKIGIARHQDAPFSEQIELIQSEIDQKTQSHQNSLKQSIIQQRLKTELLLSNKQVENKQSPAQKIDKFQNLIDKLNRQVRQIEESQQIILNHQVSQCRESSQIIEEIDQFYNFDLSRAPESVTPLVYQKNSRKMEEVNFKKENTRLVVLKLSISQFKQSIKMFKQELRQLFQELSRQQLNLREQICLKYYDLQRQYSMKIQQSIFNHKQQYQQLRYHYQQLKTKQQKENHKAPSTTQLIISQRELSVVQRQNEYSRKSQELAQQNASLKQKFNTLQSEKDKLAKQSSDFKRKIVEIEAFTVEIKQSNDKLYEYIFDLEQQLAFHKEEVPKIKKIITQELNQYHRAQKQIIQAKNQQLQQKIKALQQHNTKLQQANALSERELDKLKKMNQNYKNEQAEIMKLNEQRISDLLNQLKHKEEEIIQIRRLIEQKDIMLAEYQQTINRSKITEKGINSWEYNETRNKNMNKTQQSRIDTQGTELREDRKQLQALQMDKALLQRENNQLKAMIQMYGSYTVPVQLPVNRTAQDLTNYYIARQNINSQMSIPQSTNLSIKQRELLKYQGYLQSQAQRLQIKQKQIDIQMALRKTHQHKQRDQRVYAITANQDDYGMKHIATHQLKNNHLTPSARRNNFCSSEAQAIIQKVKMRQIRKNQQACYLCKDSRVCRCDVLSRGSHGSRQSSSREYLKIQHYRGKDYRGGMHRDDYMGGQEKNSKMKLIEDKVKRLKSQLKNSLSAMKE